MHQTAAAVAAAPSSQFALCCGIKQNTFPCVRDEIYMQNLKARPDPCPHVPVSPCHAYALRGIFDI